MSDDKKKQAMSLLFGDAPSRPDPEPKKAAPRRKKTQSVAKETKRQDDPAPRPSAKPPSDDAASETPTPEREAKPPSAPARPGTTPDPYYQGASRYRRAKGEQVKHTVYLDPDVSQAIKVSAAMGDDRRGTNVSAIVNQTLRDAGYGAGA